MSVNALTAFPVKTPSSVSKLLPNVSIVVRPPSLGVQTHQTEAPPLLNDTMLGSPASLFAPTLLPVVVTVNPVSVIALAKLLLAGCAWAPSAVSNNTSASPTTPFRSRPFGQQISFHLLKLGMTNVIR